jgi:diguanylate cyclase (GGDEF)-like protein
LNELRSQDLLTGLYNKNYFMEKLQELNAGIEKEGSAVLLHIELDQFHQISEKVGVAASDVLLCEFAKYLQCNFDENNVTARLSGNLF